MNTNSKIIRFLTIAYIYCPIFIFLFGYIKIWISLLTVGVCIFYLHKMLSDYEGAKCEKDIFIEIPIAIICLCIVATYCLYLGYGGLLLQAGDWAKHNAVLHDLTEHSWPVFYTGYEKCMLTYYLGQYIIPAMAGKAAIQFTGDVASGFPTASTVMAIWGIGGIYLVFVNLVRITGSGTIFKQFRCLLIMLFFSGVLPLVQLVTSGIYGEDMYSLGSNHWLLYKGISMQYRSNTVMLRWVFPQVVVIWLIVIFFVEYKDLYKHYVLLFAPVLIYGSFSIVMLAVLAIGYATYRILIEARRKEIIKDIFSLNNILPMASMGVILISFFMGYLMVEKPEFMSLKWQLTDVADIWGLLAFDFFMFGIYAICVYKKQKNNPLFYICIVLLSFIPCFKMGLFNDFVMCSSIPGLFMVMIWVIMYLNDVDESKGYGTRVGIIAMCLIIGAWYPFVEIKDNVKAYIYNGEGEVADYYVTLGKFADRDSDEQQDLIYNYFTYDLDGKFFYEYISRKKID